MEKMEMETAVTPESSGTKVPLFWWEFSGRMGLPAGAGEEYVIRREPKKLSDKHEYYDFKFVVDRGKATAYTVITNLGRGFTEAGFLEFL